MSNQWKPGDCVRLKGGKRGDWGFVDVFVPDSGWTVVVRHAERTSAMAGPAEAFERIAPPWERPTRRQPLDPDLPTANGG